MNKIHGEVKHKCSICGTLTGKRERVNGGSYRCWSCGKWIRQTKTGMGLTDPAVDKTDLKTR
jgi:DNA-directed RNA polymerase subunit RPC12/RpoP